MLGTYGNRARVEELLNTADDLATDLDGRGDVSSPGAYWLNPRWLRLAGGLAHLGLGNQQRAADSLRDGLGDGLGAMQTDWHDAGWNDGYLDALAVAESSG